MIKNILVSIFCLLCMQTFSQDENRNGTVYYNKSISSTENTFEINSFNVAMVDAYSKVCFVLNFNEIESSFQFYKVDSGQPNSLYKVSTVIGGGKGVYYTNNKESLCLQKRKAFGKKYIIEKKLDNLKWELFDETKVISGYTCQRAKTVIKQYVGNNKFINKVVEAWYSKELPFPFGPIGYGSLPGLILELKLDKTKYTATKIMTGILQEIVRPNEGELISELEFEYLAEKSLLSLEDTRPKNYKKD